MVRQILLFILREVSLVASKIRDASPLVRARRSSYLKDLQELILFVLPWEKRSLGNDLRKDAPDRPDVDGGVVVLRSHQDVGGSVPEGHDLVREVLDRDTESASQSKICELENMVLVDQ